MKKFLHIILFIITASLPALLQAGEKWTPAGDKIRTRWAADVNPSAPLPEYPRPQMIRPDWMNLNGLWDYAILDAESQDYKSQGKILVPFCSESSLSGVGRYVGKENALWYERTFRLPKEWKNKRRR